MDEIQSLNSASVILIPPPVETLIGAVPDHFFMWPDPIRNDPEIRLQISLRQDLLKKLSDVLGRLPDATLEIAEAADAGIVDSETLADLFELLGTFLDADPFHRRMILYVPFELVPPRAWTPSDTRLACEKERFLESYVRNWEMLLREHDVRANFVDGDILEPELSPGGQPMVCKAAHLVPKLAEKGIVNSGKVIEMATNDPELRGSVADVLPVLVDMGLLSPQERDNTLRAWNTNPHSVVRPGIPDVGSEPDIAAFLNGSDAKIAFEMRKIEMRAALDAARGFPAARVAWERRDRELHLLQKYADRTAEFLAGDGASWEQLRKFLLQPHHPFCRRAIVRGIGMAVETLNASKKETARKIVSAFLALPRTFWTDGEDGMRDELSRAFSHWTQLGLITSEERGAFELEFPFPDSSFGERSASIKKEVAALRPLIERFAFDASLARFFYPVVLLFGSRVKGYAQQGADLDVAVFIRPGIPVAMRPTIRKTIAETFPKGITDGKVVEFWLEESNGTLRIRAHDTDADISFADLTWVHVLMGSIWLGEAETIRAFHRAMLPQFLNGDDGPARRTLLEELEREALQYRLMHRYYGRYPAQGGIRTPHAASVDPQSAFWDSGYRRLATKLFIERVFLPRRTRK